MQKSILFEGQINAKQYLIKLIQYYPYDIEEATVLSLLTKNTRQHPALSTFINYFKDSIKLHVVTSKQEEIPASFHALLQKMSEHSQLDTTLQHTYNFDFQATLYVHKQNITHPYAHLALHNIDMIHTIRLHETILLPSHTYQPCPIVQSKTFLYRDISINAFDYVGLCIHICDKQGLIFLSKRCLSLALPLSMLYHVTTPTSKTRFMLLFGVQDEENAMSYYVDQTNALYIGIVKGDDSLHHIRHMRAMILTLYKALCIQQHDLPTSGAILQLQTPYETYELMVLGSDKAYLLQALIRQCIHKHIPYHLYCNQQATLHNLDNEIRITQIELACFDQLETQYFHEVFSFSNRMYIKEEACVYQVQPCISFEESTIFHSLTHILYTNALIKEPHITMMDTLNACKKQLYEDTNDPILNQLQEDFITMFYLKKMNMYQIGTRCSSHYKQVVFTRLANEIIDKILR